MALKIQAAQILISCSDLQPALDYFTGKLGFRLEMIMPADSPSISIISREGMSLRLEERNSGFAAISIDDLKNLSENLDNESLRIALFALGAEPISKSEEKQSNQVPLINPEFITSRAGENEWIEGRAGMQYRDLIPGRLGGAFIASHIRIPEGGPVPDYVHYHKVRFQMIYCYKGWVKVVYEDQGEPFIMNEGDCVLQPPEIRHRVLECSPGLEVIEISTPAIHETWRDHEVELPNDRLLPDRLFGGQKFVRHIRSKAKWISGDEFEYRDTGISEATGGIADARVIRAEAGARFSEKNQSGIVFYFFLNGSVTAGSEEFGEYELKAGECCVLPNGSTYKFIPINKSDLLRVRYIGKE